MTRDEILNMEAGREMDALVAENVMGYRKVASPSSEWFIDRNWRGLADDIYWSDSLGTMQADINGYQKFQPSTDIAAAWVVVEKITDPRQMTQDMFDCMSNTKFGYWWDHARLWASTAQEASVAICRAALLAVMDEKP